MVPRESEQGTGVRDPYPLAYRSLALGDRYQALTRGLLSKSLICIDFRAFQWVLSLVRAHCRDCAGLA